MFYVGILSARAGWMVRPSSESVQSIQLFIPGEEALYSKLHDCPNPFNPFTLMKRIFAAGTSRDIWSAASSPFSASYRCRGKSNPACNSLAF
jgi:hypothetical protein